MARSPDPEFRAGQALGEAILACFGAIAKIDGITRQKAIDNWVEVYVSERIMQMDDAENGI